jgi:hypothetical protein
VIISIMLSGEPNLTLLRDLVHAVVMLVLHGLAGLCIVGGAFRQRESEFQVEGAKAFLAVLIPMATLVLVVPNYLISAPGPYYSPLQLAFVSAVCLGLYIAVLFIQTGQPPARCRPAGASAGPVSRSCTRRRSASLSSSRVRKSRIVASRSASCCVSSSISRTCVALRCTDRGEGHEGGQGVTAGFSKPLVDAGFVRSRRRCARLPSITACRRTG